MLVPVIAGLLIAALGGFMMKSGSVAFLHSYHYATTPVEERAALARETGAGTLAVGLSVAAMGLSKLLPVLAIVGTALLVLGLAMTIVPIVRRNGMLVSFVPGFKHERLTRAALVAIAVVVALTVCVPGVMMFVSGDPSALHSYHTAAVAPEDMASLARWQGAGMVALGVGLGGAFGAGMLVSCGRAWRVVAIVCGVLAAAGLFAMTGSILYFNGGTLFA